jgi:hypothetical protein
MVFWHFMVFNGGLVGFDGGLTGRNQQNGA